MAQLIFRVPPIVSLHLLKIIYLVLLAFRDNLLQWNHVANRFKTSLTLSIKLSNLVEEVVVSSANKIAFINFNERKRSLTYTTNKRGPSLDRCGTPRDTVAASETVLL